MAFEEDISQFFDTRDFGEVAVFTRGGATVATVPVIFDDPSQQVSVYETEVEEPAHTLLAEASSVAAVRRTDGVAVRGGAYTVERIEPDGNGLKLMYLTQA